MGEGLKPPCPKIVRDQQHLTPEQEAYARTFAEERLAAMLSTAPVDEQEAEEHLRAVYRVVGMKPPATIRWFDSPYLLFGTSTWDWSHLPYSQFMGLRTWGSWGDGTKGIIPVLPEIPEVGSIIGGSIGKNRVMAALEPIADGWELAASWPNILRSYPYASRLAYYRFFHEVFEENDLIHLACLNEMVSDYCLSRDKALLMRKPVLMKWDEQGNLHNATGPCLQYRDGWGYYARHGNIIDVPEKVIRYPEQLTREDWISERNAEVRRIIQQVLGPERFVELVGGKQIDAGGRGDLIEIKLGRGDPEKVAHYVYVQDSSTEREYYLRVPPSITSADEAIAWTFGLAEAEYQPEQET
jgi:hypothetical protein